MTVPVRYYCPRFETVVTVQRAARLADRSVTPYPLEGWRYADPEEDFDGSGENGDEDEFDGIRFVCGETPDGATLAWDGEGCGEPFYLSFVRFENGREVEPEPESEYVRLAGSEPSGPRGPPGPTGPPGPGGSDRSGGSGGSGR